jgi:hypothetical protein
MTMNLNSKTTRRPRLVFGSIKVMGITLKKRKKVERSKGGN